MIVLQLLTFTIGEAEYYFTSGGADYTYNSHRYSAGAWFGIKHFEQRLAPAINEHEISIADPDLSLAITTYASPWQWQHLEVRWLILDSQSVIDDFIVLRGAITDAESIDSNARSITLRVQENHTLEHITGHRTNSASQHLIDQDDRCFDLLPHLDGVKLPWGKSGNGVITIPNQNNTDYSGYGNTPGYQRKPRFQVP